MSDQEQAILDMHADLLAANGEDITVLIGDDGIDLRAVRGRTRDEGYDASGLLILYFAIDWIVRASELVVGDVQVVPPVRSRIIAGESVFEVLPLKPDGKAVEFRDPYLLLARMHTKRLAAGGGTDALAAGGHMRVDPATRTIEANVALSVTTTKLRRIESVEVWLPANGVLSRITGGIGIEVATNGLSATVKSGVRLVNARVVLFGT